MAKTKTYYGNLYFGDNVFSFSTTKEIIEKFAETLEQQSQQIMKEFKHKYPKGKIIQTEYGADHIRAYLPGGDRKDHIIPILIIHFEDQK
jgi:hypothetical protein